MNYYRLKFTSAPFEEGDGYSSHTYKKCPVCGIKSPPKWDEFPVPDDDVNNADFLAWDVPSFPLVEAIVLLSTQDFAKRMIDAGISGFTPMPVTVTLHEDSPGKMPPMNWIKISGRAYTTDVYTRIESTCPRCKLEHTVSFDQPTRVPILLKAPETDISRAREAIIGIIASEKFRSLLCDSVKDIDQHLEFAPLQIK